MKNRHFPPPPHPPHHAFSSSSSPPLLLPLSPFSPHHHQGDEVKGEGEEEAVGEVKEGEEE